MSDKKPTKKAPKSKAQVAQEMEQIALDKFYKDLRKIETKHERKIIAMMDYSQFAIQPTIGSRKFTDEELKAKKEAE